MSQDFDNFMAQHDARYAAKQLREQRGSEAIANVGPELNVNVNFRVNNGLREEFEKLCKLEHTNMSRELKRYMSACIERQRFV